MKESFNVFELPLEEYAGLVATCCQNWRQEISSLMEEALPSKLKGDIVVLAVGSDGKEERHPQSKTELVVLYNSTLGNIQNLLSPLNQLADRLTPSILCEEYRAVDDLSETLSFFQNHPGAVFPDRILNSIVVWGNAEIQWKARRRVMEEMSSGIEGKKIREELRKQLSSHRQTLKEGRYRELPVFSDGFQYYYESEDPKKLQLGFKMGPLRAVQRRLDILTAEAWRSGKLTEEDLSTLPTDTVSRIDYFVNLCMLDISFASQLKEAYLWCLREYHHAQEIFKNSDRCKAIKIPYDQGKFDIYKEIIYLFSTLQQ